MLDLVSQQKVIAEIAFLKKTLLSTKDDNGVNAASIETHLILNGTSFGLVVLLLLTEWMTGGGITQDLLNSKTQPDLQIVGLLNVGVLLIALVIGFYIFVRLRSQGEGEPLHGFATRHFVYYRNFSILADLFVKFLVFSLIILAGKPEWIAAILVLFTADTAIHGRHFFLPLLQSTLVGIITFTAALGMLFLDVSDVRPAFFSFLAINALSLINLLRARREMIEE